MGVSSKARRIVATKRRGSTATLAPGPRAVPLAWTLALLFGFSNTAGAFFGLLLALPVAGVIQTTCVK